MLHYLTKGRCWLVSSYEGREGGRNLLDGSGKILLQGTDRQIGRQEPTALLDAPPKLLQYREDTMTSCFQTTVTLQLSTASWRALKLLYFAWFHSAVTLILTSFWHQCTNWCFVLTVLWQAVYNIKVALTHYQCNLEVKTMTAENVYPLLICKWNVDFSVTRSLLWWWLID